MAINEFSGKLDGSGLKIALVVSRFNDFLTKQLLDGAVDCLMRHGVTDTNISVIRTPGANELPMVVKKATTGGGVHAVVALGAVIQGATPHAGLINSQVSRSLAGIGLETGVPVINGVICADTLEQAIERAGTKAGNKGWNAALAAIEMANLYKQLEA